jgi:hypothetical protein
MQLAIECLIRKAGEAMKLESLLSTLWVLGGTSLSGRLMTQSVELALAATAIEWSARRVRALRQRLCPMRYTKLAAIEHMHK